MVRTLALAVLSLAVAVSASAQIYEWTDQSGSRHFTNDVEDIPLDQRDVARVVVRQQRRQVALDTRVALDTNDPEAAVADDADEAVVAAAKPAAPERRAESVAEQPRRQAQVVYDRSSERGALRSQPAPVLVPAPVVQEVYVNIDGPLSVSQVVVPPVYDDSYGYYGHHRVRGPAVSTAFDRGRFRHRTLRMVLQDQFQYDRNESFLYVADRIPRGPVFQPHLSRGLPAGRTRSSAEPTMARLHRIASPKKR